jgi:thioredoxin 1
MSITAKAVMPVTIDSQVQFNQCVTSHDFLIILFTAKWCEPCQPFAAVFAEVAAQYPHIVFAVADIDVATDLVANFRVAQVPALMVIRDRVVVDMVTGAMQVHEFDHHVHMWQSLDMTEVNTHFSQKTAAG